MDNWKDCTVSILCSIFNDEIFYEVMRRTIYNSAS